MLKTLAFAAMTAALGTVQIATAEEAWKSIPAAAAMPEPSNSGTASVNGIEMYHAVYGDAGGTPILMIHGGLAHANIWAAQVADLSQDYRVIVADTRGHGRSTNDGSAYSISLLAQDYLALLDELDVDKVHLVGWSDGANIGYEISKTAPNRLASHFAHAGNVTLAGVDPSVETNAVFGSYVGMMAGDYAKLSPTPDGFEGFVAGVSQMWFADKSDGLETIKAITVPTLVVQSEHDEAILHEHSAAIAENIPGAKLLVLEGTSHFSMFQKPEAYSAAVREWLASQ
ncbi:AB hydrolase superfamily protein YdjP [Falsiruegeria litorea R37]|uniref:AB hydrolase superfamily protein YdjP n=1 Tax=Falsiruegeria litorea R37 TaxID=1200284 RepID=A0A1Y5S1Q3_9RHOB|nr:alpha/beta fold hydrolase [Falsiruegeria litorea]SLN30596.1 AB hydrolase superfamily protein YdjP [Falsiruegeria litorea R37]